MRPDALPSQQELLRAAKDKLNVGWDSLAVRAGIEPRALKTYRLPDGSSNHRTMPVMARRAVEALLAAPDAVTMPQRPYLLDAMERLDLSLEQLAQETGATARAMKSWLLPETSPSHRGMPTLARTAIDKLLVENKTKRARKTR